MEIILQTLLLVPGRWQPAVVGFITCEVIDTPHGQDRLNSGSSTKVGRTLNRAMENRMQKKETQNHEYSHLADQAGPG
jgi:hypothetical protein